MARGLFCYLLRVSVLMAFPFAGEIRALQAVLFEAYSYDYQGQHIQGELGRFTVPEQYNHPKGRKITLAFSA